MQTDNTFLIAILISLLSITSCKKTIEIAPPVGNISSSQVFSSDDQAISAASGMYFQMINTNRSFSNSFMSILGGMSADELIPFDQNASSFFIQFQQNNLNSTNNLVNANFWGNAYSIIYSANALLAGLSDYSGVHDSVKNELIGEAKFVRAFCNFYLINLFGDVPLITSTNWQKTNLLSRTSSQVVYQNIIADLKDAQSRLYSDYSAGHGQRIIPNKWAATALLARVYLYLSEWAEAEAEATSIITNTSLYSLTDSLNDVFLINSSEAIWQLQQSNGVGSQNATPEGFLLVPKTSTTQPFAYLTNQLLGAFEIGDLRRLKWIDSTQFGGTKYYFPYKYKMGPTQAKVNGPYSEYYMVFRLSEQYLIRAEARAQQNNLSDAVSDLNKIRSRAGLNDIPSTSIPEVLSDITHERQVELFVEWGARWLDLKRTNQASIVLSPVKPKWTTNSQLYPIPSSELQINPNLTQNIGY